MGVSSRIKFMRLCHSARWHSATFRRSTNQREKALTAKKCLKGGSEYSGIFIFKISIFKLIFLRNTKNGHFEPKSDENQKNDRYCGKQSYKRRKTRSLLSWQQRTIRPLSADISGEGSFSGGRNIPRNPPETKNRRDKSVIIRWNITGAEAWSPRDCLCKGTV